jgi:hypothetical protein
VVLNEVRHNLGVGIGSESMATPLKTRFQLEVILEDPVVDHGDASFAVAMGVSIRLRGTAVGRPTGMPEPAGTPERRILDQLLQVGDLAYASATLERRLALHHDARRIVAAILETLETPEQNGNRIATTDVTNDSAHSQGLPRLP